MASMAFFAQRGFDIAAYALFERELVLEAEIVGDRPLVWQSLFAILVLAPSAAFGTLVLGGLAVLRTGGFGTHGAFVLSPIPY